MTRVPVHAILVLVACAAGLGVVYKQTRPPATDGAAPVVHLDRVSQAVATTAGVKSFRFSGTIVVDAGGGRSLSMSLAGSDDRERKVAGMSMVAAGQSADIVLDYSDGFVEYVRSPAFAGHLPSGKTWVKLDVGKAAKKQGIDLGHLQQSSSADPSRMFDQLRAAATPVLVGKEKIGGVNTSHYRATVDIRRLAVLETDEASRASLRRAMELSGTTSFPVEVWIDGDGYLRRMRTAETEYDSATQSTMTVTVTEDLTAFGSASAASVPNSALVVDAADLG